MNNIILQSTDWQSAGIAIGFAGGIYHMTPEEKEQEDPGFFQWYSIVSNHTPEEVIAHWKSRGVVDFNQ